MNGNSTRTSTRRTQLRRTPAEAEDSKPSKQQQQQWIAPTHRPGTPTIVLDQVLLPLSPTDDPLRLKISKNTQNFIISSESNSISTSSAQQRRSNSPFVTEKHPDLISFSSPPQNRIATMAQQSHRPSLAPPSRVITYHSASPSYRQQSITQPHQSPRRAPATSQIPANTLADLSNTVAPRSRSIVSPATPPKPRIWDDDNAFHAFQVEHSKLGVDLTISSHDVNGIADQHLAQKPINNKRKVKNKISMGHVEIVMSKLDNPHFISTHHHHQQNNNQPHRRLQVRYSNDGLQNLEIDPTRPSTSKNTNLDQHPHNHTGLQGSRKPVGRQHTHISGSRSSRQASTSFPEEVVEEEEDEEEADESNDDGRRRSSPSPDQEDLKGSYKSCETRLKTPFPLQDQDTEDQVEEDRQLTERLSPLASRVLSQQLTPSPPRISRVSPGGFIRQSEELELTTSRHQDASQVHQHVSQLDQDPSGAVNHNRFARPQFSHTPSISPPPVLRQISFLEDEDQKPSPDPEPASRSSSVQPDHHPQHVHHQQEQEQEREDSRSCSVESGHDLGPVDNHHDDDQQQQPKDEEEEETQGSRSCSEESGRDPRYVSRHDHGQQIEEEEEEVEERQHSRSCSEESTHDSRYVLRDGHDQYQQLQRGEGEGEGAELEEQDEDEEEEEEEQEQEEGEEEGREDSARPSSLPHSSSSAILMINENSQTNPIAIFSSVSPSVGRRSVSPQPPGRERSPQPTHNINPPRSESSTTSNRSDHQSNGTGGGQDRPELLLQVPHQNSDRTESQSSGSPNQHSRQSRSSSPPIRHSSQPHESSVAGSQVRQSSEVFDHGNSPKISRLRRSESLVSECRDVDQSIDLDDLTVFKAQGNLKHFTSTPRGGVLHDPAPFPASMNPRPSRSTSRNPRSSTTTACPIIAIVSSDPKVAARAAAILKVHHGFIPRGFKVENTPLIGEYDLEREMESSIRREENDRPLRLHSSSAITTATPSVHHNLLRTVQTKRMLDHDRSITNSSSHYLSPNETQRPRNPDSNHLRPSRNRTRSPSPSSSSSRAPSGTSRTDIKKTSHRRRNTDDHQTKSLKEELHQLNYRPDFDSWKSSDWKILEFCLKKTEKRMLSSNHSHQQNKNHDDSQQIEVQPDLVVLYLLEALELGQDDCRSEWEWTKMIHRVIALQKRRLIDPERRSRASSAATPTCSRRRRPSSTGKSDNPHHHSDSSTQDPRREPTRPVSMNDDNEHEDEEEDRLEKDGSVYPSLEPVRRLFSRSPSNTPIRNRSRAKARAGDRREEQQERDEEDDEEEEGDEEEDKNEDNGERDYDDHQTTSVPSSRQPNRIPKPPPITDRFRRRSMRNTVAYWQARGVRRVGKGKIWAIIAAFEARIDRLNRALLPPPIIASLLHPLPSIDLPNHNSSSASSSRGYRPNNKRAFNHSDQHPHYPSASSNTLNPHHHNAPSSPSTMFHPSFSNDFYSEHHQHHQSSSSSHKKRKT
ncbi:hypothetical protein MJO28_007979 [Puccinia striiformis f. sp. tritici]|uniref:Uncharacterized protein n=1 Tax=Puccinia striiformis f. sp. tritici TaxID=168172 RepID=A0ACC0EAI2_9BASI|nr:hypothetical protein MJO28_007979 [Puccinia striiformis f. sp. tritici]